VVTARALGVDDYGTLGVAVAVFSIVLVLADLGIGDAGVQRLTRRSGGAEEYRREVTPLRVWVGLPWVLVGAVVAALSQSSVVTACSILIMAVPLAVSVNDRALRSRVAERYAATAGWSAVLLTTQWLGGLLGALWLGNAIASAWSIAGLLLIAAALALGLGGALVLPSRMACVAWVKRGAPFLVTAGAVVVYTRGDRVVVALLDGVDAAGAYFAAYSLVMGFAVLGSALHTALLPRLLQEARQLSPDRWGRRSRILVVAGLIPALGLLLLGPGLASFVYGEDYKEAGIILQLLSPLVVLYLVNPFLATTLIAAGHQGWVSRVALANLALAVPLYPLLTIAVGVRGTAIASVLVEALGTSLLIVGLRRRRAIPEPSGPPATVDG